MAVPHGSLKVYEPIDVFPADERARLLASVAVPANAAAVVLSQSRGLPEGGDADQVEIARVGDDIYVCPHRSRLRLLASLVAFRRMIPGEVAEAFMPLGEDERAIRELESIRALHPEWRSHILTSTWEVPVRWFVAFDDAERELDLSVPRVRYRTAMMSARARTNQALEAARRAVIGPSVAALMSELARWLEVFDERSIVELDYGDLARLIPLRDLAEDRSARDIQAAVQALADGDVLGATTAYMHAAERWAPLSGLERTN